MATAEELFEGVVKTIKPGKSVNFGFIRPRKRLPDCLKGSKDVFFQERNVEGFRVTEGDSVIFRLQSLNTDKPSARWVQLHQDSNIPKTYQGKVIVRKAGFGLIQPLTNLPKRFNFKSKVSFLNSMCIGKITESDIVSFRLEFDSFEKPAAQWVKLKEARSRDDTEDPNPRPTIILSDSKDPRRTNSTAEVSPEDICGADTQTLTGSRTGILGRICDFKYKYGFLVVDSETSNSLSNQTLRFELRRVPCAALKLKVDDVVTFSIHVSETNQNSQRPILSNIKLLKCANRVSVEIGAYMKHVENILFEKVSAEDNKTKRNTHEFVVECLSCSAVLECIGNTRPLADDAIERLLKVLLFMVDHCKSLRQLVKSQFETIWNTPLFDPWTGRFKGFVAASHDRNNLNNLQLIQRFLLISLELLPDKTMCITRMTEPMISKERLSLDSFLYSMLSRAALLGNNDIRQLEWSELPVLPNSKELSSSLEEAYAQLLPVRVNGSFESHQDYMNTYFRLVRAQCFHSLRERILQLLNGKLPCGGIHVYHSVKLFDVQVLPSGSGLCLALQVQPYYDVKNWEKSDNLMLGNLLCISPGGTFSDPIYATVAKRDVNLLRDKNVIIVELCPESNHQDSDVKTISSLLQTSRKCVMIESTIDFRVLKSVLQFFKNLQSEKFPFREEIVSGNAICSSTDNKCRLGVAREKDMKREKSSLDKSQHDALTHALTHRVAIIQGPPGTGKTFLAEKIIRSILSTSRPVLVVTNRSYTLNKLLKEIERFQPSDVIRVGGCADNESLSTCYLDDVLEKEKKHSTLKAANEELSRLAKAVTNDLTNLHQATIFTFHTLVNHATQDQLVNLVLDSDWLNQYYQSTNYSKMGSFADRHITHCEVRNMLESIGYSLREHLWQGHAPFLKNVFIVAFETWVSDCQQSFSDFVNEMERNHNKFVKPEKEGQTVQPDIGKFDNEQRERLSSIIADSSMNSVQSVSMVTQAEPHLCLYSTCKDMVSRLPVSRVMNEQNLWNLSSVDRLKYIQCLLLKQMVDPEKNLATTLNEYYQQLERRDNLENVLKVDILSSKTVIGMTTTSATINRHFLESVKPSVVLVDEAAEILEPQLLAILGEWVEHLILIGDHLQVRPPTESFLSEQYCFDLSLMERLINNKFHYCALNLQHRMRPEFVDLLDVYPKLGSNMVSVCQNKPANCFEQTMFFWDSTTKDKCENQINEEEADRALYIALFMVEEGYKPSQITILTGNLAQANMLNKKLRDEMAKHPMYFPENPTDDKNVENGEIVIDTIDLYHGKENDFVILSLVGIEMNDCINSSKALNCRCVSLSRAKCGLYLIGNASRLLRSVTWEKSINFFLDKGLFGDKFPLQCAQHPKSKLLVAEAQELKKAFFCEEICNKTMKSCDHRCGSVCHPKHSHDYCCSMVTSRFPKCDHVIEKECSQSETELTCTNYCNQLMTCKTHKCNKMCQPEHSHEYCTEVVDFKFEQCRHTSQKYCSQPESEIRCETAVTILFRKCGHTSSKKCFEPITAIHCKEQNCPLLMNCGKHTCQQSCWPEHTHDMCQETVLFRFERCGHVGTRKCYQPELSIPCKEVCNSLMSCKHHHCKEKCCSAHTHDHCLETVQATRTQCRHQVIKKCYEQEQDLKQCEAIVRFTSSRCGHLQQKKCFVKETDVLCQEPCSKMLSCSHVCNMKCGEVCNHNSCQTCQSLEEALSLQKAEADKHASDVIRQAALEDAYKKLQSLRGDLENRCYKTLLEPSGETAAEYYKVEDMVIKYVHEAHHWKPKVTKIEKLSNPGLEKKWLQAQVNLIGCPTRHELKFHGTTAAAARDIIENGFRLPNHNRGMFGNGIYFATDSSKSYQYSRGSQLLLLCDVLLGKSYQVSSAMNHLDADQVKALGYDSVYAMRGTAVRYDEFIVYNPFQAISKYMIEYTSESNQKNCCLQ